MNGLGEDLRAIASKELLHVPEYFNRFDVRKPPKQYVEDKIAEILNLIFDSRRKVEKTLTRRELLAYDKMLTRILVKDSLLPRLITEIEAEKT